jgi:hypothetical protein
MALLGETVLTNLLADAGSITLANDLPVDSNVRIAAAAVARHTGAGEPLRDAFFGLDFAAGEGDVLEAVVPLEAPPRTIELVLRLIDVDLSRVVDVYISQDIPSSDVALRWQAGIAERNGTLAADELAIPGMPKLLIYLRAQ